MGQVNPVLRASVTCALTLVGLLPHGPARAGPGFVPETKFSNLQLDDWEPSIAADDSGHVYWATTRYGGRKACKGCPDPAIVYRVSSDAGATWSERRYVCRCRGVGGQHSVDGQPHRPMEHVVPALHKRWRLVDGARAPLESSRRRALQKRPRLQVPVRRLRSARHRRSGHHPRNVGRGAELRRAGGSWYTRALSPAP
ncbi:MAG: hypothetical protein ACRDJV_10195 [Actinomycetota bacterium]